MKRENKKHLFKKEPTKSMEINEYDVKRNVTKSSF